MKYEVMLKNIGQSMNKNLEETTNDNKRRLYDLHCKIEEIREIKKKLDDYEESCMLDEVIYDLISSKYLACTGLYRTAYLNLRSALELGMGFLYFIDRRYLYLQWKKNLYDIKWSELTEPKLGVVTCNYIITFNEQLEQGDMTELIDAIKDSYRTCSEYVHGKFSYMQVKSSNEIKYNIESYEKWEQQAFKIVKLLKRFLDIRFKNYKESKYKKIV